MDDLAWQKREAVKREMLEHPDEFLDKHIKMEDELEDAKWAVEKIENIKSELNC